MQESPGESAIGVGIEVAILQQQGKFVRPGWQTERILLVVADDVQPGETTIDVEAGDAHRVVVVPQQRRSLVVLVAEEERLPREDAILGPAVVDGGDAAPMHMNDRPQRDAPQHVADPASTASWPILRDLVRWGAFVGIRRRDRRHGMGSVRWDGVDPFDLDPLAAPHLDGWAREVALVGPDIGQWQLRVQPHLCGPHADTQGPVCAGTASPWA